MDGDHWRWWATVRRVTTIRIGRPPSVPPLRKRREGIYAVIAAVVLLLAAAGGVAGALLNQRNHRAAAPAPTTERPPGSAISELETCLAMLPLLKQSANEMTAFRGEPMRSASDMAATASALRDLESSAPEAWRVDIAVQYGTLQKIVDAHGDPTAIYQLNLDLSGWGDSGQRLAHGCLPYAVS